MKRKERFLDDMCRPFYRIRTIYKEKQFKKKYGVTIGEAMMEHGKYVRIN